MSSPLDHDLFDADRAESETDDWSDQDLLTKDEAGQRIEQVIAVTERELAEARASAPERVAGLERYLQHARTALAAFASRTDGTDSAR